jgi:hypothetical protein
LKGNLLQTFPIDYLAGTPLAMDLAPDECTMYYGAYGAAVNQSDEYNVCTNTPGSQTGGMLIDDLRVLPNWDVLTTSDFGAGLTGPGQASMTYAVPLTNIGSLRTMSLDPDGTSFWVCCAPENFQPPAPPVFNTYEFDISSGQLLAHWSVSNEYNSIAVYGPPLLGNANVQSAIDSDPAGTVEAFRTDARFSGEMSSLHLYVDSSSTASRVVVGIYSDHNGHPGSLQEQATLTSPMAGSWNYVDIPSMTVSAGKRYWIAVLGPKGAGKIRFRDAPTGPASETSAQHHLTALPETWSTGQTYTNGHLSAYGQ